VSIPEIDEEGRYQEFAYRPPVWVKPEGICFLFEGGTRVVGRGAQAVLVSSLFVFYQSSQDRPI
jgi:hypothetical protein